MALWMAFVELVSPSPTAPYSFAEKTLFLVGTRRAPTSLTHAGKPSLPTLNFACDGDAPASRAPHVRQQIKTNAETNARDFI